MTVRIRWRPDCVSTWEMADAGHLVRDREHNDELAANGKSPSAFWPGDQTIDDDLWRRYIVALNEYHEAFNEVMTKIVRSPLTKEEMVKVRAEAAEEERLADQLFNMGLEP